MPIYMDVHEHIPDEARAKDVAPTHAADLKTQEQYGVKYLRHRVDEAYQGGGPSREGNRASIHGQPHA